MNVERRFDANGRLKTFAEAVVKVDVNGDKRMSVAEGNGPVNALDLALRKDLGELNPWIDDLELVDYKVRILNGGTEAVTRVLIESRDGGGEPLADRRRLVEHHRRLLRGAARRGDLQAAEGVGRRRCARPPSSSHPAERLGRRRLLELRLRRAGDRASAASARYPPRAWRRGTATSRSARMNFSRRIASSRRISGSQKPSMLARSTGFWWRPSCAQVICSTSSSSVPTPPASATKASARSNISILRCMHVLGDDELGQVGHRPLAALQEARDDAGDGAARIEHGARHGSHQPDRAAAIDRGGRRPRPSPGRECAPPRHGPGWLPSPEPQ